jgi:hypothetical protein
MSIPRIRARVGQGEHDDKYYFEITLWDLSGKNQLGDAFCVGPFETEQMAHLAMRKGVQIVCAEVERAAGFEPSSEYLDLKNGGICRPWVEN